MKNSKLVEIIGLAIFVFAALHFFIFPGLASDNFWVNVISLTSFFLLVAFVFFGGILSGFNRDSEE